MLPETKTEESERLLRLHISLYPGMEITDCVKLLYQSEFGCGHFLPDPYRARAYLYIEWRETPRDPAHPMTDELGGGFIRVHLEPIESEAELDALAERFIASAKEAHGSRDGFIERLSALKKLTYAGEMPFSPASLEAYLSEYEKAGFPAVHHSETFRREYHPAYRVIKHER